MPIALAKSAIAAANLSLHKAWHQVESANVAKQPKPHNPRNRDEDNLHRNGQRGRNGAKKMYSLPHFSAIEAEGVALRRGRCQLHHPTEGERNDRSREMESVWIPSINCTKACISEFLMVP